MSDHTLVICVLAVCGTLLALGAIRSFGLLGLGVVILCGSYMWPTIQKLLGQ